MANQSVLELAVGTGKWDAGLKKAKQALDNFTQASGGLQNALGTDSAKMQQFVQMMGKMDSTAKTAKGQLNDYKSTIETLTMQYNRMSDAQRKVVGQDYLQAIDSMKQKYQAVNEEIQEMNRALNNVSTPDTSTGGGGLFSGDKLGGMLQVFGGNLMTKGFELATGAAMSFVNTIKDAAAQGIEMAKAGEGIRNAFERLNEPGLLDNLREATHGTVTNLELMKAAVKFNDFKLPLDQLGTMLAFAQQKAKDTGQSVDYMVDSIVTGLGRKSLMILDNLGLSATEIRERMKETGDMTRAVGDIIRDQMAASGDYVETAAERATKADVDLKNAMEDLGRTLLPLQEEGVGMWNALELGAINLLNDGIKPLIPGLINLKETIGDIASAVTNSSVWDGYISALGAVAEQAMRSIGPLATMYNLIRAIGGNSDSGDMGAGVGGVLSGMNAITEIPEITVTGKTPKPKKPKGGGNTNTPPTYAADSIAAQTALVSELSKKWNEAGENMRDSYLYQLIEAENKLKDMKDSQAALREQQQARNTSKAIKIDSAQGLADSLGLTPTLEAIQAELDAHPLEVHIETTAKDVKAITQAAQTTAKVVGTIGDAFNSIEDPAAKVAGTVAQAIASIALGYATATTEASSMGPWAWVAFAATGLAEMLSIVSAIHSATGYAEGGEIKGNSFSGDNLMAMGPNGLIGLNAGEIVLNQAQAANVANGLQNAGMRNINIRLEARGTSLIAVIDNSLKAAGRGELATWK